MSLLKKILLTSLEILLLPFVLSLALFVTMQSTCIIINYFTDIYISISLIVFTILVIIRILKKTLKTLYEL
jgi:hypothetical protein